MPFAHQNSHTSMRVLQDAAEEGLFGRAMPAAEQVFIILADSVVKQLDGLKDDPSLCRAIRRFLGKGLDAYGPAGSHIPSMSCNQQHFIQDIGPLTTGLIVSSSTSQIWPVVMAAKMIKLQAPAGILLQTLLEVFERNF